MKRDITAQQTPDIYHLTDIAPVLEIYANADFDTSDGERVLAGDTNLQNFYRAVTCSVVDGQLVVPAVEDIDTTEDSPDNQQATYSAYLRADGQQLIDYLLNFRIPPSTTTPVSSISWITLRIHKSGIQQREPLTTYTKAEILALIETEVQIGLGSLNFASSIVAGRTFLSIDPALANTPTAVGANETDWTNLVAGSIIKNGGVVLSADADASGTDGVSFKTRNITRLTVNNDGTLTASGTTLTLGSTTVGATTTLDLTTQPTNTATAGRFWSHNARTFPFTNGPGGEPNYDDDTYQIGYNISPNGVKRVAGLVNFGFAQEARFWSGTQWQTEIYNTWTDPTNLITLRPIGYVVNHANGSVLHQLQGEIYLMRNAINGGGQHALWGENGVLDMSYLATGTIIFKNNEPSTGGIRWKNAAGSNTVAPIYVNNADDTVIGGSGSGKIVAPGQISVGTLQDVQTISGGSDADTLIQFLGSGVVGVQSNGMIVAAVNPTYFELRKALTWQTDGSFDFGRTGGTYFRPNNAYVKLITESGTFQSTVATGIAPLVVASTTNVANLNASSLSGATFAAPGAIGGTTPAAAAFTTVTASGVYNVGANQVVGARGAAVADATDAASVILRLNELLARCRTHGLIST